LTKATEWEPPVPYVGPTGCVVRIWCEYRFSNGTSGIQPLDVPLNEWDAAVADKWVRRKFVELAENMAADYPAEAVEIRALVGEPR
jgi:hypothetical protein